jgi:hypothetical protein
MELNFRQYPLSEDTKRFLGDYPKVSLPPESGGQGWWSPVNEGRVFLDGVEVFQAWYINTETGVVKTYDVLGDKRVHTIRECVEGDIPALAELRALIPFSPYAEGWEAACGVEVLDNVLSKTIGGKITFDASDNR